ncbi:MAG: gliding motility-associated C-terminal domain-containing protein [Bacteroidota bacterium]
MKHSISKVLLNFSFVFLIMGSVLAQENCTNGVDDDGDGFIDCYDGECAGGPSCSDFFYGNPIVCRDEPTANPTFAMRLQWGSEDRSADSHATPAVGDLDNDNLPEVVVINRLDQRLFILNGEDGTTAYTYDLGYEPENGIVLGNLDGGDCAYIFVAQDSDKKITALDCSANLVWEKSARDRVGIMGIADFNGDGSAELYYRNEIRDAATGNVLVAGTTDNWVRNYAHSPLAIDVLDDSFCADCSGLELVTGNQIWAINIAAGTRTMVKDLNSLFAAEIPTNSKRYYQKWFNTSQNRTMISAADYNLDGHVDILMPGAYGSSNTSQTTVFLWDVFNDTYKVYTGGTNHNQGTGRLNIADIDGDGLMNTTYVSDQILYALDENLNVVWTKGIDEGSSGHTGTTVFDFDGDGAAETIYRSESYLFVIDGTDGSTRNAIPCVSRTQEEYPLVADVDNDGSSELCVPCYTSNNTPFSPYNNTRYSQIRVYEADAGEIWQPSRRVWNQHGYYVVNVNDDLTIPAQQQDHTAVFGTTNCETGAAEDNRALNGFLNQTTFLEADGCPSYVSPDITFGGNINATPSLCPETTFTVTFDIENTGDTDIYGNLPVTFYNGDPQTAGAIRLNTEFVSFASGLLQGTTATVTLSVEGTGGDFDLYISLNNSGQNPPITLSGSGFPECDFDNNIGNVTVSYTPFDLTVNKLEDNRRCDLTKPNNGEAEAYFEGVLGGAYETFWVEDFAGLSNGSRSDAGATAWTSTKGSFNPRYWGVNTKSGNKVYQTNKTGQNNEVSEVTWLSEVIDISGHTDVDLSLEMLTNNTLEASGSGRDYMRAFYILDGGAEVEFDTNGELYGSFLYAIAEQQDLNGSSVQIKVTFHTTGNGEYQYLDNVQVSGESVPVSQIFTDADGFEFYWYNAGNFTSPVATGSLYTGMPTGSYDVVGFYPGGNCYSDTVNIVINDSVPTFNVHVYEVAPYTDCADPDGALSAFVYTSMVGGIPQDTLTSGYTFSWVLSTEGITPVGTGPDLTNLGSDDYTVRVEQVITGCTSSASGAASSGLTFPADPTVVKTDIVACTGPGTTGSASASVGGITAGYNFEWFYGSVDATPEYTGSSISSLPEGNYFVRAVDNGSSCASNIIPFTIVDTSADPNPTAVEVQADSECNGNNGIATADGDGMGTTAGYTFEWFVGNNTLAGNQLPAALAGSSISADGATASGLANGTYTVKASIAGCESTTTVDITDAEVIPTYNIVTQVNAGNALEVTDKANVELPQLLSGLSSFTLSYWVEISTQNYIDDHRIFSSGGKNNSQVMLWTSDIFGISFVVKAEAAGTVGEINTLYKPTGWVQLTGTWDEASGEMKLYANGVKVGETTYFGDDPAILEGVIDNGPTMYLARDGNLGANKFEGRIDEVKIYNRVLDETEILTVLCDPSGGSTTGLQAYYDFNGALSPTNGAVVPDVSGNGNDGITAKPGAAAGTWAYPASGIQCPLAGMLNNTSCDPSNPNGEINLVGAVDPQPANYEYTLYSGTEVLPAELLATNTTGIFPNLEDGFYTVVTRDQDTNCETDPLSLSIATLPEQPSIVTSTVDNTSCSTGNGEIQVTSSSVSSEPASYTYELYDGYTFATLLQTETVADGSTGFNFTGLLDGEYRIRVINDDILCEDYVDVFVDDASVNPSWNLGSTIENDNTVCAGTPNGFASVAPVGTLSNFTFNWYTGELVDPGQLIAGEAAEFIDELAAGKYTVVATSILTGCPTPPQTVTINLDPEYPNVVVEEVQPQHSCDVGDGILRAYVDEPGCVECDEGDGYTFQWFLGTDTSTPLIEATDPGNNSNPTYVDSSRVEGLSGAYDYTVLVTNNLTGCTNEATINLTYDPLPPTIDAANSKVTANTLCGPIGNGSVVAAVNFVGETINGAVNDQTWDIITDCNTVTDLNSSILPDGSIQLTPDVNNQAGKAYLGDSVDFSTPTRIDFWMYLGNKDNGADGITFIFHQDPDGRDALGRYGCNLGIGDEPCFGGTETAIAPSVAVEFDTYNNGAPTKDPSWDHAAFVINGEMDKPQGDVGVFYNANQPRIVNGQNDVEAANTELRVTITIVPNFDGTQTFSVYVEDQLRLQRTQDFINDLFGGNPLTIGGFTASTGGAKNQQYVRLDPYFGEYDFDWYTGTGVNPADEIIGADRPFLCDLLGGDYTLVVTYGGTGCTSSPPVTFNIPNDTDTATVSFSGISNTVCDPALAIGGMFTGSLTANIAENPADYVFAWFEGSAPTLDTLATTQTITNIPGGDYTVVVESLAGGCIAIKDTTLVDVTVDPAIVNVTTDVTINNVTACEGATTYPNGSITVNTVGIGTGPFGFWYYYGADTTTGTFLTDASDIFTQTSTPGTASVNVSGNGTATLTGLSSGDYTIIVIDSASGCTSVEANVQIIDVPTIPNLDQTVTPNTVCDPGLAASGVYDGEIEITTTDGSDAVTDYTYSWFDGTGTTTPTSWTATNNILSEAPDGNYTVVATSNSTGCDTTIYATIGDATVDPTITTTSVTNVTACEGGPAYPNGSISVTGVTGTGPFQYMYWFGADTTTGTFLADGSDIFTQTSTAGTASVNVSGNGTATLTGLSAGDYTIIIADLSSGCTSIEANVQIIDVPTIPALDQNITDNTVCDPTLAASGVYDGEVEIFATDATDETTDYTYVWYDGTGTTTPTSWTVNNNILSEAPDGNYTVVATNTSTGCDTTIFATIGDATVDPTITSTSVTNVTACEGGPAYPNGSISVTGVTGTGPFEYMYWFGADTTTGTFLVDGSDIFTQTSTAGTASVNVSGNGTATLTGLSAGDYTIIVADLASGCTSIEANVQIINVPTIPALDQNITNNTVCDITANNSGTYSGEVEIVATDATDETTDYTYVWYDGTGTTTPTVYNDNLNILSEAPDGNYTVVATSLLTGCDTTIYATIGDATVDPVIGTINVTDMSVCDGAAVFPNGGLEVVEAAVTNGSGDYSYEFYWGPTVDATKLLSDGDNIVFEKTGASSGVNISIVDNVVTNLDTGFYTVVLIDNVTGCPAAEASIEVESVLITININTTAAITHWTDCANPDGEISVTASMASGPAPALGFSYEWYYGSGTGNPLDVSDFSNGGNPSGVNTSNVSGLEDGTYTVLVTNNDTECTETAEFDVEDNRVYPVINPASIVTTDNVNCSGTGTGTIDPTGAVTPATGIYLFTLYDAAGIVVLDTEDMTGADDGIFTGLSAGNYRIGVELASTGCTSITTVAVTVEDDLTSPSINFSLTPETSCASPNGAITLTASPGVTPTGGWEVNIFQGSGTGGVLQENIGNALVSTDFPISSTANLDNGLYTIQVINNQTGCDSLREVTIVETLDRPTGIAATRTNNTFCTSDNGTVTITSITNGGATPIYNIYAGSTATGTPDSISTDNVFENLPAGPYTVTVTKAESGCESTGVTRTITNTPIAITGTVSLLSDQTSCDLTNPNGQLTANPTSQTADPTDFTFEWFQGPNTNPANAIPASAVTSAVLSGTNNRTVTGLPAGTYRVRITNTESGCFTTVDQAIIISTTNPSVAAAPGTVDNTSCVSPDGQISITITDGSAAINDGAAGYTFELFEGTSIAPSSVPVQTVNNGTPSPTNQVFTGLLDGDYIIRATDNNTNCKVVSTPVNVGYNGLTAVFDESLFFKQAISACFDEDGIIDVGDALAPGAVTLGGGAHGPITITWYAGTDTTITANLVSNLHNISGLSSPVTFSNVTVGGVTIINGRLDGLPAISYTGVVTLSNGCQQTIGTNLTLGSAPDVVTAISVPNTRCDAAYDGEVEITMTAQAGNSPDEYSWYVFEGNQSILPDDGTGPPFSPDLSTYAPIADNGTFTSAVLGDTETMTALGLASGDYTLGVKFDADGCIVHVSNFTIDEPEYPELTEDYVLNNSVCDLSGGLTYNGAIVVDAIHNTLGGTFDFAWYYDIDGDGDFTGGDQTAIANGAGGAGAGSNVTGATTLNANSAGISGIGPGWYRVIAIHNDGGSIPPATACPDTLDIQIFDEVITVSATAGVDYTFNDMDDCNGFGDFNLTQVVQSIGGVNTTNATVAADYTVTWTKDGGAFVPDTEVSDADLAPGDYSLDLVQDSTGCSTTIDFTIDDITEDPIIELVLITDNTTCAGGANLPTGAIEVQIVDGGGVPLAAAGEFTIAWYENALLTIPLGTTVGSTAGADNEQAIELTGGTYYVEVTDVNPVNNNDACVASASYTVVDNPADVSIQTILNTDYTIQHQTDCAPVDGAITLLNVYEDGVADLVTNGNYLFNWYSDNVGTVLGIGTISGLYNETVSDLPFGTYYVEAENQSTDCISPLTAFTVQDQRTIPSVQIAQLLPDTTCVGSPNPSGHVEASAILPGGATGNPADFTFTWYQGAAVDANFILSGVPGPSVTIGGFTIGGTNNEELSDVPAGQYTVSIEDNVSPGDGCTATATITVTRFTPVISILTADISKANDTDCTGDNGSATVNAITVTKYGGGSYKVLPADFGDWSFRWYTVATGGAPVNITNSYNSIGAGTYYIEVENNISGCIIGTRKAVTITNDAKTPLVQLVTKSADEYCTTVANVGDGALQIKIVHEGLNPADSTDYTITWYRGTGTTTLLTTAPGSSTISPNGTVLTGLSAGTYTVMVSDDITPNFGCNVTQTFTVNRDVPTYSLPQSAMTLQDNLNCTSVNGSITINGINIDGVFEDFTATTDTYTFTWPSLPGGAVQNTINFAGDQVTNLPGGTYQVTILNTTKGCSISANITIDDDTSNPLIQLVTKSADTYCTTTAFDGDGALQVKLVHEGNNPADSTLYTFEWFRGTGVGTTLASTLGPNTVVSPNGTVVTGLSAGTYTVRVTDANTPNLGCVTTQTFTINRDAPTYSLPLSVMTIQDNLNCTSPNGSITIDGLNIDGVFEDFSTTADNYTINWTGLPGGVSVNTVNQTDDQVSNLIGGTYTVDISNDRTGCTVSANITIDDDTSNPLIQLVTKSPDNYCTTSAFDGDGALQIKLVHEGNNPADSTLYIFEWFRGTGVGTTLASTLGPNTVVSPNGTVVTGLSAGTYTVRVTDANSPNLGCITTQTFTINRDAPTYSLPLSVMTIQDNLNCGNPNGSITIDGINIDGVFEDFSTTLDNYTINWTGLPGTAVLNTVNFTDDQVTGLDGGVYSVDVTNDRTGCTVSANVVIDDITSNPLIQLVIKQADEYCDNTGFVGNGSLEMRIVHEGNNPANPTDYTITWYRGTGTGTTLASAPGSSVIAGNGTILSGLSTGTYTVVVAKNGSPNDQCTGTTTFSIVQDPPQLSIQTSSVMVEPNTNCTNPNGSIQITNVVLDGVVTDISTLALGTYSFDWIPAGLNGGFNTTVNQANDRADDLPAGTYNIIASNLITGCSTDTISVVILDDPTEPVLSWSMDSENTNCGPTKNGQLTVTATTADGNPNTNVGRYTFTWYDGQGTSTPTTYIQFDGIGVLDNQSSLQALDSGYYTVEVFDNVNECTTIGTYAVSETLDQPQVLLSDIVVRADTTCNVGSSGTIIVADSSFASGVLNDFDVEIRSGSVTGPIVGQSIAGGGNTDLTVSTLDPGTFYVTATRASSQCPAAPVKVIILDQRIPPSISLDTIIPNPNCGGIIALGSIAVTADGFDETNPNYLFQWYVGTIGGGIIVPGANGGNTATIFDVAEGQYELQVTSVSTGCVETQLFDLPAEPVNPRISSYSVSNNLICNVPGDGSFEINQIRWNGNFYDVGVTADSLNIVTNYTFEYYSDAALTTPVADIDLTTPLQLDGLSAGTYYARVRRNDSQCASGPIEFTIQDLPQYPVILLSQIEADSTCNGLNPNGTLTALVDGVSDDINYTYDWYEVDPGSGARISGSLSTNDTIFGLATGRYELEVTGLSTGCISTAQRNVTNAPIEVEILAITSVDPTTCNPPNGSIEVTSIAPGLLTDYDFAFYLGDPGSGGILVQSGLGPVFSGGAAGTYYVEATHNVYGCTNNLNEVELQDNITYPDINLVFFANQTNCDPGNPNGELSATADGTTNTIDYTFEWRDSTNTVVAANSPSIANIPAGAYTLNVTSTLTGCVSSSTFEIINDYPLPINLVISTSPNTNCINPNGEVSATIRNIQKLGKPITDYIFYWFIGDQTAGIPDIANPDYQGTLVTDLPDGDYTVYVVDATDVFCTSDPTLVTIQDRTLPPPFEIEIQNHVTICYDSLPDGRARIRPGSLEPNREFFEFTYEWYLGTAADTAGQTPFVTGIRADSLDIGTYSVLSVDLRTGCENLITFDIIDDTDAVPAPDVNVISDRDNCLFANGHARASISGSITDYRFDWFLASGDTATVQFTGHEIFTLDSIDYKVQATRLSTGCVSPKTPVNIENVIVEPVRAVVTTTSLCLRTEDGAFNQFTGTAEISFEVFEAIKEIDWIDPNGDIFSNDIKLVNAQPGKWTVRFVTDNDCEYFDTFWIETALKIYNGVSANADGLNDYFFIDCIDYFEQNNVQIFNRDGTRVWEADGYNNLDVKFEGFSNVGRNGLQLPAGTYFYIITKGPQTVNGETGELTDATNRPRIQGYLELVR